MTTNGSRRQQREPEREPEREPGVEPGGEGLDPASLAPVVDAALSESARLGCRHAEVRVERIRSQVVRLRDGRVETTADDTEYGVGLRVLHAGAFGFAATVAVTADDAAALAEQATAAAATAARATSRHVELADEPSHGQVRWRSPYRVDPATVPLADKVSRLEEWSRRLLEAPGVDHVTATVLAVVEDKHFANLEGTVATQRRVRVHPVVEALALGRDSFETMRTLAPPTGRGWEYLDGEGWDWDAELAELPELLSAKLAAPSVEAGTYDLVVDPSNLWLTIHESIGHATELDRAMGFEAAYAGTSFATPDKLGSLRYGSPVMHVTGDRTTPHGLATVAVDDEGVAAGSFDLVRQGVLVGYQLDRAIAAEAGLGASNGCAFADSPLHVPIQRMANVSLQPAAGEGPTTADLIGAVDRGIYIVGDKSWSIDMQRYNFQFTGQRFFAIRNGRLAGQVRDVAYQATTTEFWGSLEAVGGRATYVLGGAFNCGKGQPGQVAPVSHGCPSALVRGVRVLNARQESGR
ncbi:MAG TPA: TldD/PmbA family protein [Acidimicrobiales bacterium]|nr:TldD/PmbA family protein [Acidimicrobiales bacterium]